MDNNPVSKSWFGVFNNPENHGYRGTPQEICEQLRDEWLELHPDGAGAWTYCRSATGLLHIHMIIEDKSAMRFSDVKNAYAPGMHFEVTKGNKKQADDYINKRPPYDEEGEEVLCVVTHGEYCCRQGKRSDLEKIYEMIKAGMKPAEIFDAFPEAYKFAKYVYWTYWRKLVKETPPHRDVAIHFLFGLPGSGKSYNYVKLCEQHGEDNVYLMSDYSNNGGAGLDLYLGEPYLFMDELRDGIRYSTLLQMLQGYKQQFHARYNNGYMVWTDVTITSVYAPEELFNLLVPSNRRDIESFAQLMRRLTDVTYCFRGPNGEYYSHTVAAADYVSREKLIAEAYAKYRISA